MREVFVDYAAGCPVDSRVIEHMRPYFDMRFGNPSSLHTLGLDAKKAVEDARQKVSQLIGAAKKDEIIFTSGATEANNLAIVGYSLRNRNLRNRIIISKIEHMSVINAGRYLSKLGFEVVYAPVDHNGRIVLEKLSDLINDRTLLVSVAYANGEIGTIQDIPEISKMAHEKGAVLHSDGVPSVGRLDVNVARDEVDMLTLSSNDIYGPRGVGALYIRSDVRIQPIIFGGGQEKGLRSGTENVPGIVGFGKAAEITSREWKIESDRERLIRDRLIKEILTRIEQSYLNGHSVLRLPNNASFRFIGIEGESLILTLDQYGIMASTGSACSSKTLEPSHVLMAIVSNEVEAHGSLTMTLGKENREEDVERIAAAVTEVVAKLREMSPLWGKPLELEKWRKEMEHREGE